MKKIFALLVTALMVLSLVGCTSEPTPEATGTPEAGGAAKEFNVGVSIYKFDDNFMTLYRQEIESYFSTLNTEEAKYNVTVQDAKNDMAEQSAQIDAFIAQDVDVMIINLVQSTSAALVIEKCESSGIPCIFINREPSEEDMTLNVGNIAYVGADARQSGKMQGEIIADLDNKGDLNGDGVLSYVMVVGDPENVDAQYRTEFSISQYIETSGLEVEKLDEQRGDWDQARGQEIVAAALAQHGEAIEVVFCNNDGMALGALQAITAAGRVVGEDIYLVGVDALDEVVDLIETGEFTGTVLNDHISQSHTAVDAAVSVLNGEALETYYWVDYVKVVNEK